MDTVAVAASDLSRPKETDDDGHSRSPACR
jgi:hypothetical protein